MLGQIKKKTIKGLVLDIEGLEVEVNTKCNGGGCDEDIDEWI